MTTSNLLEIDLGAMERRLTALYAKDASRVGSFVAACMVRSQEMRTEGDERILTFVMEVADLTARHAQVGASIAAKIASIRRLTLGNVFSTVRNLESLKADAKALDGLREEVRQFAGHWGLDPKFRELMG